MAVLATLLAGKPWLAVDFVLFAAVPAAGLTAFLATRRVTSVLAARIWLAATYALLPVAMGAVAAGRIGTAVAFVLLPLIGIAAGRMLTGPPRRARRAAWAAGLLTAVAAAFVPLVWPITILAAVGLAAAWTLNPGSAGRPRSTPRSSRWCRPPSSCRGPSTWSPARPRSSSRPGSSGRGWPPRCGRSRCCCCARAARGCRPPGSPLASSCPRSVRCWRAGGCRWCTPAGPSRSAGWPRRWS